MTRGCTSPTRSSPARCRTAPAPTKAALDGRWKLAGRPVWRADDWCYLEAGEGRDGLALLGPDYKAAGPHFAFHFRDRAEVDVIHDRLKAQGVHVGAVHDHRDGTASFYLKDPEGNWLEMLYEPPGGIPSNCS